MTARRLIRSCDPIQLGKLIVEIATGQVEDQTEDGKNPAAVARGRKREEGDQPLLLGRDPLHALESCAHPSKPPDHPGDGGRRDDEALVIDGHGSRDRSLRSATRDQTLGSSHWLKKHALSESR